MISYLLKRLCYTTRRDCVTQPYGCLTEFFLSQIWEWNVMSNLKFNIEHLDPNSCTLLSECCLLHRNEPKGQQQFKSLVGLFMSDHPESLLSSCKPSCRCWLLKETPWLLFKSILMTVFLLNSSTILTVTACGEWSLHSLSELLVVLRPSASDAFWIVKCLCLPTILPTSHTPVLYITSGSPRASFKCIRSLWRLYL